MTALVPYAQSPVRRSRRGATSLVQLASDGVVADVRIERVDRRNRCSWYALELASNRSDLTGRLVGLRRGGVVDELGSVDVAPSSVGSARFAVTTPRTGAYEAMYLEIRSGEMLLRVEAPRPPAPARFVAFKAAGMLFAIGVAASCAGAIPLAFARDSNGAAPVRAAGAPAVPALAQPPQAPSAQASPAVLAPARVISFAARRDDAPGGETVLASYLAVGERGTVALLDASGTVIAAGPFTRLGTIRLPVPRAYRTAALTAQITVHRGETKAVSGVSVPANALATPRPSPSPDASSSAAAAAASALDSARTALDGPPEGVTPIDSARSSASGGIVAIDGHAVAGRPLRLRLTPQASAMHAELQDESGATLAEAEIAAGAKSATLPLPPATASATYLLALHYTRNGGEETVIRTVIAAPR
jgi:hypothetical protein